MDTPSIRARTSGGTSDTVAAYGGGAGCAVVVGMVDGAGVVVVVIVVVTVVDVGRTVVEVSRACDSPPLHPPATVTTASTHAEKRTGRRPLWRSR
jgi:L-cystine uptake protein TcyP (sodium:dicarboxylate symporter family)